LPLGPEPAWCGGTAKLTQRFVAPSAEEAQRLIELSFPNQEVEVAVITGGRVVVELEREERALEGDYLDLVVVKDVE
jgi:hypothetical protein